MSEPIPLFRFVEGSTVTTFTSANKEKSHGGETYVPKRGLGLGSSIESSQSADRGSVDIIAPKNDPFFSRIYAQNLRKIITVILLVKDGDDVVTAWSGQLVDSKTSQTTITLTFDDGTKNIERGGLNDVYQRGCRWQHYGRGCYLNMDEWAVAGTLASTANKVVTVAAAASHPDGYFIGGIIKDVDGNQVFILKHVGDTLTLFEPLLDVEVSDAVTIYPGCDGTPQTCKDKFNNIDRCGAFPDIPVVNIRGGSPIS